MKQNMKKDNEVCDNDAAETRSVGPETRFYTNVY